LTVTQAEREFQRTTRNGRNAYDLEEELCSRLQTMIDTGETLDGFPNLDALAQPVAPPKPTPRARPSWLDENRGKPPKQPRSRGGTPHLGGLPEPQGPNLPLPKGAGSRGGSLGPTPSATPRDPSDTARARSDSSGSNKKYFEEGVYSVLHEWWAENIENPYPDREERDRLCKETGLTHKQLVDWFANRRKRSRVRAGEENTGPQWREPGGGRWNSAGGTPREQRSRNESAAPSGGGTPSLEAKPPPEDNMAPVNALLSELEKTRKVVNGENQDPVDYAKMPKLIDMRQLPTVPVSSPNAADQAEKAAAEQAAAAPQGGTSSRARRERGL